MYGGHRGRFRKVSEAPGGGSPGRAQQRDVLVFLSPDEQNKREKLTFSSLESHRKPLEQVDESSELLDSSDHRNNLQFYKESACDDYGNEDYHDNNRSPPGKPPLSGLTRSARTLNLVQVPAINDYMDNWSPFEERPETPANLKRTASKSELSPFVNDPEVLRKWMYKKVEESPNKSKSSSLSPSQTHFAKQRKTYSQQAFSNAKPDQSAFMSTGLKSKMQSHLMPQVFSTPDTPVKKSPLNKSANTTSIMDSPMHSYTSITAPYGSINQSPLSAAHSRFNSSNITQSSLSLGQNKHAKASKVFSNTVLTNTLQQFTDDLYGNDDDDAFLSDCAPSTAPTVTFSGDPNSPSHTPTKSPYAVRQPSPFLASKPKRSINAKISRATSPSLEQLQISPDSHLATKFSNVGTIGSGHFSSVYQVTFEQTGIKYAVKSMRPNKFNSTARILQEIEILSQISETTLDEEGKDYVLNFISSWKFQGNFYVMTEYCENGDLDSFLKEQVMSKKTRLEDWRIWKVIVELSLALNFIHDSCQIAHLDMKPANVLITFEGSLKLADFGMAAKLPVVNNGLENEGDREYIAPEIISDCIYDFRADIFSLGLMIVEIAANVMLPDNGNAWHKLRSGDLSDAGKLSSTEIHSQSLFSSTNTTTEITNISSQGEAKLDFLVDSCNKIPAWVPKFLIDGVSLERMVRRMIEPDYRKRPTASEILHSEECKYVEMTRKAGAIVQEDDFGPKPEMFM
ncbi:LAME_0G03642g1_1 [Lachancea meyersii CBS 8951]|uniref:LAME_0G03642g1_1 n=1 Tax=Lachancea meyersii CBS 8951 TaxID=1266667 RepID=A0A1G4K6S1_9SACH|nr:LAME_0G03642g1_1 [Lachancea meyersii CBS 8951]